MKVLERAVIPRLLALLIIIVIPPDQRLTALPMLLQAVLLDTVLALLIVACKTWTQHPRQSGSGTKQIDNKPDDGNE